MTPSRIYKWARSHPTKTALIDNDREYSYGAFARAIEAARSFFEPQGLPAGRTAIVFSASLGTAWIFVIALRALGLDTVAVQSLAQAEALKLRNVAGVVVPEAEQNALALSGHPPAGARTIVVPSAIFSDLWTGDLPSDPDHAPPLGAHIIFTSGTTGTYKKLVLDGRHEDRRNAARAQAYGLSEDTVYHGTFFGLWTTIGFRLPVAMWHVGGCVVFDNAEGLFSRFFRHAIDYSILTPLILKDLLDSLGAGPCRSNCELLVTAGFLPIALAEETVRRVTRRIGVAYGSSELATPAMLSPCPESLYWLTPALDRSIEILDDKGRECPPGQAGELRILLKEIDCAAYLDDEEASARMFQNGFFCPGDMAVRRADGRVRILGRTADVLNVRGNKIAVAPLEQRIQRALGVAEVCLFSGLNNAGNEELVIAIQSDAEPSRSALDAIADKFSSFERVRFTILKEFPRTATGTQKTRRPELRKLVFPMSGE